jgi:hypothetical protein
MATRYHAPLELVDWLWYAVYPAIATLAVAATGLSLAMSGPLPLAVLAAGMVGHLVVGIHNAWELADWLATRQ